MGNTFILGITAEKEADALEGMCCEARASEVCKAGLLATGEHRVVVPTIPDQSSLRIQMGQAISS
jgi:hypothetical protein